MFSHINLRVPNQNGVSLLYIMLEIHHSGQEPSICTQDRSGQGGEGVGDPGDLYCPVTPAHKTGLGRVEKGWEVLVIFTVQSHMHTRQVWAQ